MILICLLIYIIGFFVTHWVIGPIHHGIEDDPAQRALALLWPITGLILITAFLVFIARQMRDVKNYLTTETFNTTEKPDAVK
jgi:hypothetical protein